MIRTYILNRQSKVVHLMLDAKTDERCNIDDIRRKSIFTGSGALDDLEAVMETSGARACKRCFVS